MIGKFVRCRACLLIYALLFLSADPAWAGEAGPRAYANVPTGLNVLQVLYSHAKKRGSYDLRSDAEVLYYYKYFDAFGKTALIGGYLR